MRRDRLASYAASRAGAPFRWGVHDCVLFGADWVAAATGRDPAQGWRGYATAREALRILGGLGGVRGAITAAGLREIPPAMAARGDVGVVTVGKRDACVIVDGDWLLGAGAVGVERVPRRALRAAFEVS